MSETTVGLCVEADPATATQISFQCQEESYSIETEPRTLSEGELQDAREAAVDIIQNKRPDEARTIFTRGLRRVRSVREMKSLLQNQTQQQNLIQKSQSIRLRSPTDEEICARDGSNSNRMRRIVGPASAPF